jgi:hypothetical protein
VLVGGVRRRRRDVRGRRLDERGPAEWWVALELLHLALQLVPVENGGDAVVRGCPVVAVDAAQDAEEEKYSSDSTQNLEDEAGGGLVVRGRVEVGWGGTGAAGRGPGA